MLQAWEQAWASFKDFLNWLSPPTIGALYAIVIVFSILFDLLYLRALGISIMVAPTSIADHIRSSVIWIPPVLVATIATIACSAIWSYFYDTSLENLPQITISQRIISLLSSLLWQAAIICVLVGVFCLALLSMWWLIWYVVTPYNFPFGEKELEFLMSEIIPIWAIIFLYSVAGIVFFSIVIGIFFHDENIENSNRIESRIMSGVTSAIFTIFLAFTIHVAARSSEEGVGCSEIVNSSLSIDNKGARLVLLRSFTKYFLVFNCAEGRTEFLKIDEVDSISVRK